ncbi:MAG: hypothetical protein GEV07_29295 [Streptosporangiales bacterium]|nr:hypothetical protein [Streptosporangiales bacterium]
MTADAPGRSLLAEELRRYPSLAAAMADGVGVFCAMGVCQQCERQVAGTTVRTCLVRSSDA